MATQNSGGLQFVPQIAVQYIYLDFDGELTSYNGEILTVDDVEVKNSDLNAERIATIISELNARYAEQNVIFVTERPETVPYSTIFVGKTSSFDEYGNFAGLAEALDKGNVNKSDNAFVMLDASSDNKKIFDAICHETDHLIGTLIHGGTGLASYALVHSVYTPGTSARNLKVASGDYIELTHDCKVFSATVESQGALIVKSGGSALFVRENGGYVSAASGATVTFVPNTMNTLELTSGSATAHQGTTIKNLTIKNQGCMNVHSGGNISKVTLAAGYMHIYAGGQVSSAIVSSGGHVFVSKEGKVGTLRANSGAYIYISSGIKPISSGGKPCLIENGGFIHIQDFGEVEVLENTFSRKTLSNTSATVHSGTRALQTALTDNGALYIYSGGVADVTHVISGKIFIYAGGVASSSIISNGSCMVQSGGTATLTTVKTGGILRVFSAGTAKKTEIQSNGTVRLEGFASGLTLTGGELYISTGAQANGIKLSSGYLRCSGSISNMEVYSGGEAQFFGANLSNTTICSGGLVTIENQSLCSGITVQNEGYLVITSSFILNGENSLELQERSQVFLEGNNAEIIFSLSDSAPQQENAYFINDFSRIFGTGKFTISCAEKTSAGIYNLAQNTENFSQAISLKCGQEVYGTLTASNSAILKQGKGYSLNQDEAAQNLQLHIKDNRPLSISLSDSHWQQQNFSYYLQNNSNVRVKFEATGNSIDLYGTPDGNYQWDNNGSIIFNGNSDNTLTKSAKKIFSEQNGALDAFFASSYGIWESGYAAQHQGILNGWTGTGEQILLEGKNKITDVFNGSTDANVLVLTDDTNGDALFVDDIYSALGEEARLSRIDEIRAGAGNDIVDLTSQRYAYIGKNMTVYGGSGDDTIWANNGSNTLFGDAGNDRIVGASGNDFIIGGAGNDTLHGGGGSDTFCFGANFGNDTIEQLAGGSVTLHFETGSDANWNADTLTYTDGANSVTVSGVTDVTLVFGGTAPVAGAFLDAASEKIFEDKNKGMIA